MTKGETIFLTMFNTFLSKSFF